ncbi:NAD(P)H-quinone oxidoreductase [Mycetocola manganoxydans]|uniref:NAD(P)H-quinone oxidoreductase n=2 Tax=Mycetocola manganoxydans TaxID=699879 RepID=A0A3L6ZK39_9MICO|nr:NAD(P)H-quinone oxidoreductase [Mycetocola manganoxydans]GHD43720.1 NAD(P)H quinone oxidoreductase [Mycetocola manganoxydans]
MRAVEYQGAGGPEVMRIVERPRPQPKPGEVLVRVAAAGLNRADVQQRKGVYPPPKGASDIPGLEVSGTIAELGDGVDSFGLGEEVCALLAGGGYAEYVAVPAGQVLPVPTGTTLIDAAALPEVVCTVWSNLFMNVRVEKGNWVLIHGGAGGIGTMATQLVAAHGAHPVVTAGSEEKLAYCYRFGAEAGINYRDEDFVEEMLDLSDGHGADVILDVVGATYLDRNLHALAPGGRLVVIGLQGGAKAELDLGLLMSRRASVHGTTLRARPIEEKARIVADVATHVWPLVAAGTVRTAVEVRYPLDQAAAAHEHFDSGEHTGKILLTM